MSKHLDQYDRRNNIKIQGISTNVTDDELEGKVIDIFSCLCIEECKKCHRVDYANPKNTIVRSVNRYFCYQALDKKNEIA